MSKKTFETAMARLEEISALLEQGTTSLEETLKLFQEGYDLAQFCESILDQAEKKIKVLTKDGKGFQLTTADYE